MPGNITSPQQFRTARADSSGSEAGRRAGRTLSKNFRIRFAKKFLLPLVAQMQAAPEPQLDGAEEKVWELLSLQEAGRHRYACWQSCHWTRPKSIVRCLALETAEYDPATAWKEIHSAALKKCALLIFLRGRLI